MPCYRRAHETNGISGPIPSDTFSATLALAHLMPFIETSKRTSNLNSSITSYRSLELSEAEELFLHPSFLIESMTDFISSQVDGFCTFLRSEPLDLPLFQD